MKATAELGTKYECPNCGVKYYDLGKADPLCPKCGATVEGELPEEAAAESGDDGGSTKKTAKKKTTKKKTAKKKTTKKKTVKKKTKKKEG